MATDEITHLLQRFERMETKIDKLTEATLNLARVEERLASHMDGVQRMEGRLDKLAERLEIIERRIDELEQSKVRFATLVGVVSGAAGMLAPYLIRAVFGV